MITTLRASEEAGLPLLTSRGSELVLSISQNDALATDSRSFLSDRVNRTVSNCMEALQQELRTFIVDNFLFGQNNGLLHDDTSFLEQGIIDSTGVLELISFLNEKYDVQLSDDEIIPENLDSIDRLVNLIERKRRAVGA